MTQHHPTPEQQRRDEAVQAELRARAGRPAPSPTAQEQAEAEQRRQVEEQRYAENVERVREAGRMAGLQVVSDRQQAAPDRMPPRPAPARLGAEPSAAYDAHISRTLAHARALGLRAKSDPTPPQDAA